MQKTMHIKFSVSSSISSAIVSHLCINVEGSPLPETAAKTVESVLNNSAFTVILEVSIGVVIFLCIFIFVMEIKSSVCSVGCNGSCGLCLKKQNPEISERQDDKTSSGDATATTAGELDEGSGGEQHKKRGGGKSVVARAAHRPASRSTVSPELHRLRLEDAEKLLATLEFVKYMKMEKRKRYHDTISLNSNISLSIEDIDIIPTKSSVNVETKRSPRKITIPIDQFSKRALYT